MRLLRFYVLVFVMVGLIGLPSLSSAQWHETFILGAAELSQEECISYIKARSPHPKLNCSVEELVQYYYEEAKLEGIRPDLALSQAILETDCFKFGKDVFPEQNNYCGLGATGGGVKGAYFDDPRTGVRAHIQHLLVYCTDREPKTEIVDPRFEMVKALEGKYNSCRTWESLSGHWAVPGKSYGAAILKTYNYMQQRNWKILPQADIDGDTILKEKGWFPFY